MASGAELLALLGDAVSEYAIFLIGPDGTVQSWNRGAQRVKGYRADEIIGRHFSVFYTPEDIASGKPDRELDLAAAEGTYVDDGWRVRADGSRFWAHVVITALYEGDTLRGYAKVTRDDTTARAAQLRAEALAQIAAALLADQGTGRVLALIAAQARRLVGGVQAWITSPTPDGKIDVRAADGDLAEPQVGEQLPATGTVTQRVLDGGEPVLIDDLPTQSRLGGRVAGAGAALAVPLVAGSDRIGVLTAAVPAGAERRLRASDLDLLRQFADQAAVVLGYERAQQALRERRIIADRERIASDLLTEVVQELSWITMRLQAAVTSVADPRLVGRIRESIGAIDATIRRVRDVAFRLHTHDSPSDDESAP